MSAATDLISARRLADKWRMSVRRLKAELSDARTAGDAETAAEIETRYVKVKAYLHTAEDRIARLSLIAGAVGEAMRTALKVESVVAEKAREWEADRERRPSRKPLASDRRETDKRAVVDSPYGRPYLDEIGVKHNRQETVVRVFHTIESMRRRRQIDERQKWAADRYRWAFENCAGSLRCALDQSTGNGGLARSPSEDQLQAAEWLSGADRLLGVVDGMVVRRICGEGATVEEIARARPGRSVEHERKIAGDRLRTGLRVLADHWWPPRHAFEGERARDARPTLSGVMELNPAEIKGRVAHARLGEVSGYAVPGGRKSKKQATR